MKEMGEVYKEYAEAVYRYLLALSGSRDVAEELTQETFYQAIRASNRFEGRSKVSTWLCAIAKRVYLAYLRKHPKHEDIEGVVLSTGSVEETVIAHEERKELLTLLHGLDEPSREVVYLRIFGELTFREIGEIFGKTENWARVTYFRSKEKLRKEAEKNE